MTDKLGDRMKRQYEDRSRFHLPRRTYTVIRIDGKAFHTYTRHAAKPFDYDLMENLDRAAVALCEEAMGCRCAYGQSDEYSFLLTDFEGNSTEAWFDGNLQKIASVAASIFTAAFNRQEPLPDHSAHFDARVFTIPDPTEVENYFIWRQQDATRNAILMVGYAHFSPKQMHGLNVSQVQEKLFQERGINFNDFPARAKRGRIAWRELYQIEEATRSRWVIDNEMPVLTQQREYFCERMRVPIYDDTRRGASTDGGRPDKADAKESGGVAKEEACPPNQEGV